MQYRFSGRLLGELKEMAVSYDDEVLPQTPADLATPFIFQPGQATSTLFTSPIFPSQTGASIEGRGASWALRRPRRAVLEA